MPHKNICSLFLQIVSYLWKRILLILFESLLEKCLQVEEIRLKSEITKRQFLERGLQLKGDGKRFKI